MYWCRVHRVSKDECETREVIEKKRKRKKNRSRLSLTLIE